MRKNLDMKLNEAKRRKYRSNTSLKYSFDENSCAANARSHTLLEAFLFCYGKNQDSRIA